MSSRGPVNPNTGRSTRILGRLPANPPAWPPTIQFQEYPLPAEASDMCLS